MFFSPPMVLTLARQFSAMSIAKGLSANKTFNAFRIFSYEKRAIFKGIRRSVFLGIFKEEKRQYEIIGKWLDKPKDKKRYIPKLRDLRTSPSTQYQYPLKVKYTDRMSGMESERFVTIMSKTRLTEQDISDRLADIMDEELGMFRYFRDSEIMEIETYPYLRPKGRIR